MFGYELGKEVMASGILNKILKEFDSTKSKKDKLVLGKMAVWVFDEAGNCKKTDWNGKFEKLFDGTKYE